MEIIFPFIFKSGRLLITKEGAAGAITLGASNEGSTEEINVVAKCEKRSKEKKFFMGIIIQVKMIT